MPPGHAAHLIREIVREESRGYPPFHPGMMTALQLGHVALDRSKVEAEAELAGWLRAAEAQDSADDAEHGPDRRGDEPPDWMRDKQRRRERIGAAKAALAIEAEAGILISLWSPGDP